MISSEKWLFVFGCSAMVTSPTLLCFCYPKLLIGRFQKELLVLSVGTICSFLFIEIMPCMLHESHSFSKEKRIVLSTCVLIGMIAALLLGQLHQIMEHVQKSKKSKQQQNNRISCNESSRSGNENSDKIIIQQNNVVLTFSEKQINFVRNFFRDIPYEAKIVWFGTAIHNFADGMMIGLALSFTGALPLFFHEITHTLCNFALYIAMGISKEKAIFMRILSCTFVFFGAIFAVLIGEISNTFHIYGHAIVFGIFVHMMLVDFVPAILGSSNHLHCHEPTLPESKEMKEIECSKCTSNGSLGILIATPERIIADPPSVQLNDGERETSISIIENQNENNRVLSASGDLTHGQHKCHHKHIDNHSGINGTTWKHAAILLVLFLVSFGIVAAVIIVYDPHSNLHHCHGDCEHTHPHSHNH